MNRTSIFVLKCLRHAYQGLFGQPAYETVPLCSIEEGGELIYDMLSEDEPCMIARYGANELNCILNYLEIKKGEHSIWKNIKGESHDWWWNKGVMSSMENNAGFFPPTDECLSRFSEMMLEESNYVDAIAIFLSIYRSFHKIRPFLRDNIAFFPLLSFNSFLMNNPWTRIMMGKRVLVIHPFAELIENQYKKRLLLFDNDDVLPDFHLRTIKAVQSLGGESQGFEDWFEALEWMKNEMDKEPYDIALIGCGAYGFPLAAHAKRTGHKAVHIGGSLQLLFGIKGKRWENPLYGTQFGIPKGTYPNLMNNPYWVRPDEYRTIQSNQVENACYW